MNNIMQGLYTQNQSQVRRASQTPKPSNEPIDISSGDENDDESRSPSNGAGSLAGGATVIAPVKALKRPMDQSQTAAAVLAKKGKNQQ